MPPARIRADYDELAAISKLFRREASDAQRTQRQVQRQMQTLQSGEWIGKGANTFYKEMEGEVLPSLKRLSSALNMGDRVTRQIAQIMKQAEEEAARLLRIDGVDGSGQPGAATRAPGGAAAGGNGGSPAAEPSLLSEVISQYDDSLFYKVVSGADSLYGIASHFQQYGGFKWAPPGVQRFLSNSYLGAAGKGLGIFGAGLSLAKFIEDPGVQTGADLGVSGIGLYGGFASGPGAALAGAFAGGYAIGSTFIAPHTTEPLSNALTAWDPLDLGYSPGNYPNTTIKDYQRSGQPMPLDVAQDVYRGLASSNPSKARQFASDYASEQGISEHKVRFGFLF